MPARWVGKGLGMGIGAGIGGELTRNFMNKRQQPQGQQLHQSIQCQKCGAANQPNVRFCGNCGDNLAAAQPPAATGSVCACGTVNDGTQKFCGGCGIKVGSPAAEVTCGGCGANNGADKKFCLSCGFKLAVPTSESPGRAAQECCGDKIAEGQLFCAKCGKKVEVV